MVKEKDGFLEWLKKEITSWKMKGWISRTNGLKILSYYGVNAEIGSMRSPSYIRPWFFVLGLMLAGLGILAGSGTGASFLPRPVMTVALFVGVILLYAVGYFMYYLKNCNNIVAEIILGLGILLFGYSLWYFNQAYNIYLEPATLFLIWSVGFLPLVLMFPFKYVLWLDIVGFIAWTVACGTHFKVPNYPFAIVALVVLFPLIYYRNTVVGLILGVLGFSLWAGVALNSFSSSLQIFLPVFFILWSLLLFVLAELHLKFPRHKQFAPVYQILGLVFGFLSLSFTALHALGLTQARFLLKNLNWLKQTGTPILIFAGVVTVLAILFLLIARFKKPAGLSWSGKEIIVFGIMALSAWAYFIFPEQIPEALKDSLLSQHFLVFPMIFTLVLFVFVVWVIYSGITQKYAWLLNLGVLMLAISIFARFFDNFLPMWPKNIFLIVGGVVLLLVGVLYKNSKAVAAE
jgi:uncharacterized membrane protein